MYFPVGLPMRKRVTNFERFCATETNYTRNCDSECACSGGGCDFHGCVNRQRSYRWKKTDFTVFSLISLILSTHVAMTTANIMGDECDWFGR